MRIQIASPGDYPSGIELPWETPLAEWPKELLIEVPRGISRNVVRFLTRHGFVYALKELPESVAIKEYRLLRELKERGLPVVEPIGLVTERAGPENPRSGILVTRYLKFALPFRILLTASELTIDKPRLLDALVNLLVRLHLAGFYWGDCSLSNTLFRRDAGRLAAYLVDAETGELRPRLSAGQRAYDLELAQLNIGGELMDLETGFGLPEGLDPIETSEELAWRYQGLWDELTRDEVFTRGELHPIEARIKRLNELGFDVEELELTTCDGGQRVAMRAKVVEPGHHRRLLQSLTGLVVEEHQSRRLLNDIYRFGASLQNQSGQPLPEIVVAYRWYTEVYLPTIEAIPSEHRGKLDGPEIFHQILEHRWYMSESTGRDVGTEEATQSYIKTILTRLPVQQEVGVDEDTAV